MMSAIPLPGERADNEGYAIHRYRHWQWSE
jgi:hypothetical protein